MRWSHFVLCAGMALQGTACGEGAGGGGSSPTDLGADVAGSDDDAASPPDVSEVSEPDDTGDDGAPEGPDIAHDIADIPDPPDVEADVEPDVGGAEDGEAVIGCPEPCLLTSKCVNGECIPQPQECEGGCGIGEFCNGLGLCEDSDCKLPSTWSDVSQKTDSLVLPDGSFGCDLTGDGLVDNKLGVVLKLMANANIEIKNRIAAGSFALLFEAPDWNADGASFVLTAVPGELSTSDLLCSPTDPAADCNYSAWETGYTWGPGAVCPAVFTMDMVVKDGVMSSLGEQEITLILPIIANQPMAFEIKKATLVAQVVGETTWESTSSSLLCGAVPELTLLMIIDQMPQDLFDAVGVSKEQAKAIVTASLDVDVNNDGWVDSLSAAAQLTTIPGSIIEMY